MMMSQELLPRLIDTLIVAAIFAAKGLLALATLPGLHG